MHRYLLYGIESETDKLEDLISFTFSIFNIMDKKQAEINIAQSIGEVRQLMLWHILSINPTLSLKRARKIAEEEVRELFCKLEGSYKSYFFNS